MDVPTYDLRQMSDAIDVGTMRIKKTILELSPINALVTEEDRFSRDLPAELLEFFLLSDVRHVVATVIEHGWVVVDHGYVLSALEHL